MNDDRKGWLEGARLTLVAVVSAVVAATLVIQVGSVVRDGREARAQAPLILTSH